MPPKLPQQALEDNAQRAVDLELVSSVHKSIEMYKNLGLNPHDQWSRMSQMLSQMAKAIQAPLEVNQLRQDMSSMRNGGE